MADTVDRLFVVISEYLKPVSEVDKYYEQHAAFLAGHYASNRILGSGRRDPKVGGIIIMRAESADEVRSILADDPFQKEGCAAYWVFGFTPNPAPRRNANLQAFFESDIDD